MYPAIHSAFFRPPAGRMMILYLSVWLHFHGIVLGLAIFEKLNLDIGMITWNFDGRHSGYLSQFVILTKRGRANNKITRLCTLVFCDVLDARPLYYVCLNKLEKNLQTGLFIVSTFLAFCNF